MIYRTFLLMGCCWVGLSIGCLKSSPPAPVVEATPPAPQPEPEPTPVPVAQPIQLGVLTPITLDPAGRAAVEVQVERQGNEGPIAISVTGAPEGITTEIGEISADSSQGQLVVFAAESLGDEALTTSLNITAKIGEQSAQQTLSVLVNKLNMPSLTAPATVILQPGMTTAVKVPVQRNGYSGPLTLQIEELPAKVTAQVVTLAADQSEATIELVTAGDTPDANQSARIAISHFGRQITAPLPVRIDRQPFAIKAFQVVTLKPGESQQITVSIERRSYRGPLRLGATALPAGVTAQEVAVSDDQTQATLVLSAAATAEEHVRSAQVVALGGELRRADALVVRVSRGEGSFLSWELASNREIFPQVRRGSFGGRLTSTGKAALAQAYGGTQESEAAVLRGLQWLAAHQQADGRWPTKDYSKGITGCDCHSSAESEVVDYDSAGTAFGVLPFLGAGIAHNRAPDSPPELASYQKTVERAIAFLVRSQVTTRGDKNLGSMGGNLYAHAFATMALCEAYGLSGDEQLKGPAQLAIKYLLDAQHSAGGGWRYSPNQAGDLSATSWMFLALRTAQYAGLTIEKTPLARAERFIDSCAAGPPEAKLSRYAYQPDGEAKLSLTAAGLLTREYLGWKRDHPHLQAGTAYLMQHLPPESASQLGQIYYYYYATQALHHREGAEFDLWNHRMREHLLRTQETQGHAAGSWSPAGVDWGKQGGRLYATCLALSTLEVYYRHFPMYRPVSRPTSL